MADLDHTSASSYFALQKEKLPAWAFSTPRFYGCGTTARAVVCVMKKTLAVCVVQHKTQARHRKRGEG